MKNDELKMRVHFRPNLSASGPAAYGAEILLKVHIRSSGSIDCVKLIYL